ncbi:MAG TPA: ATP-binding protein [Vicinamibacterales bacterium]|jgi:two-component system nitrogen regulation sensor histidine kinase NtrY|nr:ATP-binding protein [Vicinamibacterales bacterium]
MVLPDPHAHASPARPPLRVGASERRPFRDNPRLILAGIVLLLVSLVAMITLADRSTQLNPDFLSEVVLYALTLADATMLLVLVFVLARNVIKLVVERRRGLPFSRFRLKLVAAFLGLTILPSVLVLLVGGELIRKTTERWFSQPVSDVLTSANEIAGAFYRERETDVASQAARIAGLLPPSALSVADLGLLKAAVTRPVNDGSVGMVEIYRVQHADGDRPEVVQILAVQSPSLPRGRMRASADRLAVRVATGSSDTRAHEPLDSGGELVRAGALVRNPAGAPAGVVIVSDYLPEDLSHNARRIAQAYEEYTQLRVLKRPLEGVYLSLFLMMTLLILVSATWFGLYLAKRITRPVNMLAAGAREIGAGHLDHRIEPETRDEFGSLVEAFNAMAGELASSQRRLERSRFDLERKNAELDERRRYIETVLERIATGVVSFGPDGRVSTINAAAVRLLDVDAKVVGADVDQVFRRDDLQPLAALVRSTNTAARPSGQEVALAREGREIHVAAAATALVGENGEREGTVLVFDDVTPLVRTQRVAAWRDVARRLAHEIKNPLTPIQLCAERIRRHLGQAPSPTKELVEECTSTIVGEVESLKALVDEFAQFARMPAPRAVPSNINTVIVDTLALYNGLFSAITLERRFAPAIPPVRLDVEQIRRVVINLIDNAIEALGGTQSPASQGEPPRITIETQHDPVNAVARVVIADNGPGVPLADREKLFMPYYSTKHRGSGLGLAIVRRIVAEHGGSIEVGDNTPAGSRFVVELPC